MMKFSDIEEAYFFVNSGHPYEHSAFVSRLTGETYWQSEASDLDELPEDVAEDEDEGLLLARGQVRRQLVGAQLLHVRQCPAAGKTG